MVTLIKRNFVAVVIANNKKKLETFLRTSQRSAHLVPRSGYNLFKLAVKDKRLNVGEILAKYQAKFKNIASNQFSQIVLHDVVRLGCFTLVKIFVCEGADVKARGRNGITRLHFGAGKGHLKIMKYLLDRGASVNFECTGPYFVGYIPLHFDSQSNNVKCVKLLLQSKAPL